MAHRRVFNQGFLPASATLVVLALLLYLCSDFNEADAYNIQQLKSACRPEDGFHFCTMTRQCLKREIIFPVFCDSDRITCNDDEFKCRINFRCIQRKFLNTDGGCMYTNRERVVLPCRNDEYTCPRSRICLPRWNVGDNIVDCISQELNDTSDELSTLECRLGTEFKCPLSGRCIPREWVNDGSNDCLDFNETHPDAADETISLSECFNNSEFRCVMSGRCLKRFRVVDGFNDCNDGSDEINPLTCYNNTEFKCQDNGRCIPRSWILDGTRNCQDGSDEVNITQALCTTDEFLCHNKRRCIPLKYLCDGMNHCGDCSDEIEACEEPRMWRCDYDPSVCIPQSYACDTYDDCPSGVDNPQNVSGFKCKMQANGLQDVSCAIPQWMLHDNHTVCPDKSDECYANDTFSCSYCVSDKKIISRKQICDGVIDCADMSDECLCRNVINGNDGGLASVCNNLCLRKRDSECTNHCDERKLYCREDKKCISSQSICDGKLDCPESGIDEGPCHSIAAVSHNTTTKKDYDCVQLSDEAIDLFIRIGFASFIPIINKPRATKCDGIVECARFEDECEAGCEIVPEICETYDIVWLKWVASLVGGDFNPIGARTCPGYQSQNLFDFLGYVVGESICNGISECINGTDEISCPKRFNCNAGESLWPTGVKKVVSIEEARYCDGNIDCVDSADEKNCTASTHFYCTGRKPLFVPRKSVLDGKRDCEDNSDECPPFVFDDNPFSSREEMISNPFFRFMVWLMASLALLGNALVIVETYRSKDNKNQTSGLVVCNKILITNLAVADFLMGLALLFIGIKSFHLSGQYCLKEKSWRTSVFCNFIGFLTVLASESSVFTLVLLACFRIVGVYRPFQARNLNKNFVVIGVAFVWIISGLIAAVPLFPVINQSMVTDALVTFSQYFQSSTASWSELQTFATRLSAMTNSSSDQLDTWGEVAQELQEYGKEFDAPLIIGYFGYYSTHGVCLSRLFKTPGASPLHALSIFMISVNFICLFAIIAFYSLIYYKSVKTRKAVGSANPGDDRNNMLQRKITILIATDVCCWLPICFMTFLSNNGLEISQEAYAAAAIVLLPINSSLNPVIYSNGFSKARKFIFNKFLTSKRAIQEKYRG